MKKYEKPTLSISGILSEKKIASLNDWLTNVGADYSTASITTYCLES